MIRMSLAVLLLVVFVVGCQDNTTPQVSVEEVASPVSGEALQNTSLEAYRECISSLEGIKSENSTLEECYNCLNKGKAYLEQNPPRYMQASEVLNLIYNSNEEAAKGVGSSEFFHLIYIKGEELHSLILQEASNWVSRMNGLEKDRGEFFRTEIFPRFAGRSEFARNMMCEVASIAGETSFFNEQIESLYDDWGN